MIPLSPYHQVELAPPLRDLVDRAPDRDQAIRTLFRKEANGQPLIQCDLVVAGKDTREEFPLADRYPVHFRKSYYPTCFHQHPDREYENHLAASEILPIPPPIGSTRTSFRCCFIPGVPLSRLSPFGTEPYESNIATAQNAEPAGLIALWRLLEDVHAHVGKLHAHGLAHGDLFLHNVIVSLSPLAVFPIDFELARRQNDLTAEEWDAACHADFEILLREAVYVLCGLGRQSGSLGEAALSRLPGLVGDSAGRFERAIDDGSTLSL